MSVLIFIFGILLALGIARYNESNKLFWQLTLCFVTAYAVTVLIQRITSSNENGTGLVQVNCPTQMPTVVSTSSLYYLLPDTTGTAPVKVTALDSVVQDITPKLYKNDTVLSMVFGRTRDQPILTLTQPPEC